MIHGGAVSRKGGAVTQRSWEREVVLSNPLGDSTCSNGIERRSMRGHSWFSSAVHAARWFLLLLLLLLLTTGSTGCFAATTTTTVYVDAQAGHDGPGCGAASTTACASLRSALTSCSTDVAAACMVLLAGGTYAGPDNCGLSIAPPSGVVTVMGAGAAAVTPVQCSSGSWLTVVASNVTVAGVSVSGCTTSALVVVGGGSHLQLAHCVFAGNSGTAAPRLVLRLPWLWVG